MPFEIEFTKAAAEQVRSYKTFEQQVILDAIEEQLANEPAKETRNRKPLRENKLSDWELRVQRFRVFYDVLDDDQRVVKIKAVGHKEHNVLFVAGRKVEL